MKGNFYPEFRRLKSLKQPVSYSCFHVGHKTLVRLNRRDAVEPSGSLTNEKAAEESKS